MDGTTGPMDPTKPALYTFLQNLFEEVVQLFPDKYLHVGGDEVPFECWESNPDVLTFMRDHNITKNFTALENIFINRLLDITYDLNVKTIVWQEVIVLLLLIKNTKKLDFLIIMNVIEFNNHDRCSITE